MTTMTPLTSLSSASEPSFSRSRLSLARRRRGLTKRRLAALVGLSEQRLAAFEAGRAAPSAGTLEKLSTALAFPPAFFYASDLEELPADAVSFRAMSKITASQRDAARAAGSIALELDRWISERFRLPAPAVPRLNPGVDPETAAEIVRDEWDLGTGPIKNLVHLLESRGVRVYSLASDSRALDAFSFWRNDVPYIFLNTKKSAEHARFDAAHELGHLVVHWHHAVAQGREAERDAQAFASCFLMPRSTVLATAERFPTLHSIMSQKQKWRVSAVAYVYRLHALQLLSDWHYRSLMKEMSRRGYRSQEPYETRRETSQVLSKVFAALRKDRVSRGEIADELYLQVDELDSCVFGLAMLPVAGDAAPAAEGPSTRPALRLVPDGV